jgi:osmotically-inducible protein OsmY
MLTRSTHANDPAESAHDRLQRQFLGELSCDCRNNVLYLRGHTHSFYQKQLAQEVVRGLDGIKTVVNEIDVDS